MNLSRSETILNEDLFLQVNQNRANGPPDSWETIAAIRRLQRYHAAKGDQIPEDIINTLNSFLNGVQDQESENQRHDP